MVILVVVWLLPLRSSCFFFCATVRISSGYYPEIKCLQNNSQLQIVRRACGVWLQHFNYRIFFPHQIPSYFINLFTNQLSHYPPVLYEGAIRSF